MSFPIYITGLGIVSAIGINKQEVLSSLQAKQTGIGKMRYLGSEHTELPVGEVSSAMIKCAKCFPWKRGKPPTAPR